MSLDAEQIILRATLRVRSECPFFGCLILYAKLIAENGVGTAATDGNSIFYEPDFIASLGEGQVEAVLLHEVLHCALLHVPRRGTREGKRWNVAADIVVNGMIAQQGAFVLPEGAIRNSDLENYPVEVIYDLLPEDTELPNIVRDLRTAPMSLDDKNQTKWRMAVQQALVISENGIAGWLPAGFRRELSELSPSRVDWKARLWRFLVQTPVDFTGFDRRFISQGLYIDALEGERILVDVAIDTSGSIDEDILAVFLSELRGILRSYPHMNCRLFYADAELYGPWDLRRDDTPPRPVGGGGTSFEPFFSRIDRDRVRRHANVCVYLTDGYGVFPERPPKLNVLWVVPPGGLDASEFPFGTVVQLRSQGAPRKI